MKTVSVDLSEDLVAEVQAILQKRLAAARQEVELIESQIKKLAGKAVAAPRQKHDTPLLEGMAQPAGHRFTKAEVKKTLLNHLKSLNGHGIGITDLYTAMGASYSTTFRALRELKDEGVVVNVDAKWKFAR